MLYQRDCSSELNHQIHGTMWPKKTMIWGWSKMFFRVIITKIIFIYHYLFVIWLFLCEKASEVQLFYIISCKQYYHRVESALKDTFHRQTLIGTLNKIHVQCTTQWQSVLKCKVIIQFSEPPPPKTMLKYCGSVGWKKSTYLYLGCGRGR